MANRISVIIDATVDKAITAVKGFRQSILDADGVTGKFKAGAKSAFDSLKANAALGTAAAGAALIGFGVNAVGAAKDLDESINAVNVTFGKVGGEILELGKKAAESVGLSNAEFNGLAVQFSSFATTVAGTKGDVVGTIDEMTTRVADFASVMNLDVPEAARIFQSALAGETEPIKRFGIDLSAASVAAFAVEDGIIAAGESMTESDKTVARYRLLMQETAKTAGDFALTSDGVANSQRILKARAEDTAAAYGKALTPALEAVIPFLQDGLEAAEDLAPAFQAASEKIGEVVASAGPLIEALGYIAEGAGAAASGFEAVDEKSEGWFSKVSGFVAKDAIRKGIFGPIIGGGLLAKDAFDAVTGSTDKTVISLDHLDERSLRYGATTKEVALNLDHLDERSHAYKLTAESVAKAEDRAREASEERTSKLREQIDAMIDLIGKNAELVGGDIAVREAQREAAAAVAELNLVLEDQDATAGDVEAAQDGAAGAVIAASLAAAELELATREANGEQLTAATSADTQRRKLIELAETLAPGSALRVQIQGYIDDLARIPSEVRTTIRGDIIGPGTGAVRARAHGGPVSSGKTYLVGEQGPELLTMGGAGHVTPNNALGGVGVGGGGGGVTVVFQSGAIVAGMGANGKEIGDQVVNVIRQYERRNGNGWRT